VIAGERKAGQHRRPSSSRNALADLSRDQLDNLSGLAVRRGQPLPVAVDADGADPCYRRCAVPQEGNRDRVPWWVRAVLLIAAAQALLLLAALVDPPQVKLLVPWPASPLNARFIAALYVSLGAGVVLASTSRRFTEIRLVLFGIGMATMVLLVLTIVRMALHPQELQQFPFFWLLFYVIDPLLVGAVFWRMGWGGQAGAGFRPITLLWIAESLIFGSVGIVLMIDTTAARSVWPWAITEPQAQIYSAFFLTLAVVSLLAAREERWEGVRWFVVMITLLSLLVIAVSILHLPRFTKATTTALWFVAFGVEAVVFGALLLRGTLRPREIASA
jgi:hypothetical protein